MSARDDPASRGAVMYMVVRVKRFMIYCGDLGEGIFDLSEFPWS